MKNKIVIGNWKLNPKSLKDAKKLFRLITKSNSRTKGVDIVICPSTLHLSSLKESYSGKKIQFGAQDVSLNEIGAHTGDISAAQLKDLGINHVIVGHSERRVSFGEGSHHETDELVAAKLQIALKHNLTAIVCVGESRRNREGDHLHFIANQVRASLHGVSKTQLKNIIIAYEPLWAIGSGQSITPHDLHEMSLYLQKVLINTWGLSATENTRIIYGGSVKPQNVAALNREANMSGFLVGGASLEPDDFAEIVKVTAK